MFINSGKGTHNNIIIANSTFTDNTVGVYGGGLHIYSKKDTHNNMTIINCMLANNTVGKTGGGLHMYFGNNTHNDVTITNSVFTYNTVHSYGGGLRIYSENDTYTCNNVTITNSIFTNNIIGKDGGGLHAYFGTVITHKSIAIINSTFTDNAIGGNGGGLHIHFNKQVHIFIIVTYSIFTSNKVNANGGGLYIHSGTATNSSITITNSTFSDNIVDGNGGGLRIHSNEEMHTTIIVTCSIFTNNKVGTNGGGLYIHSGTAMNNSIVITCSIFTNNIIANNGGGLRIYSINDSYNHIIIDNSVFVSNTVGNNRGGLLKYSTTDKHNGISITNSVFNNNNGSGLVLRFVHYHKVVLSRVTVASNNNCGILAISHCTIVFTEGHSIIAGNRSPLDDGGIYLGEATYLTTSNGGYVSFINNTAHRYGGAIYSLDEDYTILNFYFDVAAYYGDHCTVYDLSANFINNSATVAGDQLYGGVFIFCHTVTRIRHLQDIIECTNVPANATNAISVHPRALSQVSSDPLAVCHCNCVDGTVNCSTTVLEKEVYPGEILNVSLVTIGLCGGISPGTIAVKSTDKETILISSTTTTDHTATSCTTLSYTVRTTTTILNTTLIFNIADSDAYNIRPVEVRLSILPCPLGLVLDSLSGECVCSNHIQISQVLCNITWMPYPIQRSGNNWISSQYNEYNCTITHIGCPFDYCNTLSVKFSLSESDLQCNYNRSGILCGQCQSGLSLMIGSNRCTNCTDTTALISISIVIMAATAGIVLVIFLLLLNLTVSTGSINGLLFYVNVVKLNESVFFSQGNIPVVSQFISWCNLDLGIEYCFMDGLDGYVKTWLQFVFPLYVWVLVIVIIVGCRYSSRLCHLCGRNAVPVLATLILMSYTKLSRSLQDFCCYFCNALMMNTLQCGES